MTRVETMNIGKYQFDIRSKELRLEGKVIKLGAKTIDLLLRLVEKKGEVVSLNEIEERLWHTNEESSAGAVRVYVTALKKYFPNIENIRGIGYRLKI